VIVIAPHDARPRETGRSFPPGFRSALKKFINKRMERRPMILPIIMEI
jgi:mRNA degradation ribonuclease J1/J2